MVIAFKGRIKMINAEKRFGFITPANGGEDIHFSLNVVSGTPVDDAEVEGEFKLGEGRKGPSATKVRVLAEPAAPIKYYVDVEKKNMRSDLLCKEAKDLAEELSKEISTSSTQMRRFFKEVRDLEKIVGAKGFDATRARIGMLVAKAHYAFNRQKIGPRFRRYLENNVEAIQDTRDFEAFVKSFEAVVAYFPQK
ncbi:MAG: type III-A CRISPR-associated protein Csm2 [Planctomycetota bacterium]